jgi:hypothetical protein
MALTHIIRAATGCNNRLVSTTLTRAEAIKVHCTECCGFEAVPNQCLDEHCALFPFRGKSRKAWR